MGTETSGLLGCEGPNLSVFIIRQGMFKTHSVLESDVENSLVVSSVQFVVFTLVVKRLYLVLQKGLVEEF